LQEAGDAPRLIHEGSSQPTGEALREGGGRVSLESGFDPEARTGLRRLGHQFGRARGAYGGYQAILWDHEKGVYIGASESRKDGYAAGY
ncbi:MAG: gamma-glutamyltranspeptidase/glutathione hydrolase, partial [Gammaproteobacteria bacterium]